VGVGVSGGGGATTSVSPGRTVTGIPDVGAVAQMAAMTIITAIVARIVNILIRITFLD
jgi:hypothetical protein